MVNDMKKLLIFIITAIILFIIYTYKDQLFEYIVLNYIYKEEFTAGNTNEYKLDYNNS